MPGFAQDAQASTDITAFLNEFINKPGGINIILHTTQTTVMSGILISGPVPQSDANCKADLRANRGK